jgi:transcriptional regulator with XRE-family HTH domain
VNAGERAIAERIMRFRIAAGLTSWQLAGAAGVDRNAVGQIEDAARPATPAEVAALAGALGMSPAALALGAVG